MTNSDYPTWDEVAHIHCLYEEENVVDMVLSIAEYGYMAFFTNYRVFLGTCYPGHSTYQNMIWDQVFLIYTDEYYSQLWRGLDHHPYGYLQERKYRKDKRYAWFNEMYTNQSKPAKVMGKISEIFS
jgi:hypothetical protein